MIMIKGRMDRRWSDFTMEDVQKLSDMTPVERYTYNNLAGEYTPPFTEKLADKQMRIVISSHKYYDYKFRGIHGLQWSADNEKIHEEFYQALELPGADGIILVQHYCKGSVPPTVHTLVLDLNTGLATVCVASAGVPTAPREIQREFFFGLIEGYEDPKIRHEFTEDMVGKAIYWTYRREPLVRIKHIYTAPLYYTYQMTNEQGQCWVASNPADFIKIADQVYVFSFVEERQAGTQGFFLINLKNLHDVGSFFGIQAHGMECCMFGAKGEFSSPYAWDWCEKRKAEPN